LVETKALVGLRGAYRLARDVTTIEVPVTVQAILAARIDRLAPEHKRLLQAASAIGKDVPFTLLRAIADLDEAELRQGLAHLQAAEFLYEASLFPDLEHTFKHALTHEVTYSGLLLERRRHLHARIVEATETFYGDRLSEHVERLAHHAVRGEVWDKAVSYLRQAGHKAMARSAPEDARGWFDQALGVLATLPEAPSTLEHGFEARIELRPVLYMLGEIPTGLERLREAALLAERLNDDERRARAWAFMALTHTLLGESDEALAAGDRAFQAAERLGDLKLRLLSTTYLVQAHQARGEYERLVELATRNVDENPDEWRYERFGNSMPLSIYDRGYLVRGLVELGRFEDATLRAAEGLRLAEPMHQMWPIGWAQFHVSLPFIYKGDWARAHAPLEEAIAAYRRGHIIGLVFPNTVALSAWVLAMLGQLDEASDRYLEGLQLLEHAEAKKLNPAPGYRCLSLAALQLSRLDDARQMARRAFEASAGPYQLHLLGDVAAQPALFDPESSEDYYRRALELASRRNMRPLIAHCHLGLGTVYLRTGRREEGEEHLTTAITMYREMDMRFYLKQAEAERGALA
jgi:tetratricopeptide (TPR) repeat protein